MPDENEIPVFYEAYQVASLQLDDEGRLSLAYDKRWLATSAAFPISLSLPLAPDTYGAEVVHPWLANLLPEERQLAALAKIIGVDRNDTIAILREIGGDTAGALSFGAPSDRKAWTYLALPAFYNTDQPDQALSRHFEDLKARPFLVGEDGIRLSLAGGQQKSVLTVLDPAGRPRLGLPQADDTLAIPGNGAPSTIIIKPDNPRLPGIVENEAYCLNLANAIGIEAAQTVILTAGKRNALAVARYDRNLRPDGEIRRLHQEDFAQANGVFPTFKYETGSFPGPSLQTLIQTANALPSRDALRLLDQIIFNILVANSDAHAKNYALLLSPTKALAPLYDVSTVLPWRDRQINQTFAQKIAGKKRRPGDIQGRHWDAIAGSAGLNAREVRLRVQELVDRIIQEGPRTAAHVAEQAGAVKGFVDQAQACVEHNALAIARQLRDETARLPGRARVARSEPGAVSVSTATPPGRGAAPSKP